MNNKKNTGKLIALVVAFVAIVVLFNPNWLTFLPEGTRAAMDSFIHTHYSDSAVAGVSAQDVLAALLAMFTAWVIASISKMIIGNIKFEKRRSETLRHLVGNLLKYVIYIVGFIVALGCLGVDTTAMFVSVGVVGIVVGFGAQSLIEDVITGLFIIFEGEFQVGDIITIDGFRGEVKTIGLRTVSIIDNGGNIRIINNSEISSLVNLSDVTSVAVVNVPVSYEDKLVTAEEAVKEALSELPSEYPDIFKEAPIYRGVDVLAETHIELQVLAKVSEENIYTARRIMQREIKYSCEKAGMKVPSQQ
jgi:small conductance mechanosensitive channel